MTLETLEETFDLMANIFGPNLIGLLSKKHCEESERYPGMSVKIQNLIFFTPTRPR